MSSRVDGLIYAVCTFLIVFAKFTVAGFSTLDESLLLKVSWPGPQIIENEEDVNAQTHRLFMTTIDNEKYSCYLPELSQANLGGEDVYGGPEPYSLLKPLFNELSCTYKLEQFWTYELCHGRYLRQYHEHREVGKKPWLQEYTLGMYDTQRFEGDAEQYSEWRTKFDDPRNTDNKLPTRKVEDKELHYISINMTMGSQCDINNKYRTAVIYYVCFPGSKYEIYSLEESSTCEYEVVVLTPALCDHPYFKVKEPDEHAINCRPVDGAPAKPRSLRRFELDNLKKDLERRGADLKTLSDALHKGKPRKPVVDDDDADEDEEEVVVPPTSNPMDEPPSSIDSDGKRVLVPTVRPSEDAKLVRDFLNGQHCFKGGTSWWRYKYCHGWKVEQYHEDVDFGTKTVILLGTWDKQKHVDWIKANPNKRPKDKNNKLVSHFYSTGSVCEMAGKERHIEVKLKCKESMNLSAVSLYLLEPKTCEYILGVESSMLCPYIKNADENGLFQVDGGDATKKDDVIMA